MRFSIIIPCKQDSNYLKECIENCKNLDYDDFEIIVLPDAKIKDYKNVRVIPTGTISPSEKREIGAKSATGEILAFIDDDAFPRKDWLKKAAEYLEDYSIGAIGGPTLTPDSDSLIQKAGGSVMSAGFGSWKHSMRYTVGKQKDIDDWPTVNLLVRKKLFFEVSGFNTKYWPGEDTVLCLNIINSGKRIVYAPKAVVFHHRRPLFKSHLKQIGSYGLHRGFFVKAFPKTSLKFSYFVPSLLFLFTVFGFLFSLFSNYFRNLYFATLSFYLLVVFFSSLSARHLKLTILTFFGILATHYFYGVRFIQGILSKELER